MPALQGASSDLSLLADLGIFGIVSHTADATYATRTITAGTGLGVTNGGGVAGNPTIAITDAELLALMALTSAADALPYFMGSRDDGAGLVPFLWPASARRPDTLR